MNVNLKNITRKSVYTKKTKKHNFLNYFGGFNTSEKHIRLLVKLDHVSRDSRWK